MRNDSSLYSGASSTSFGTARTNPVRKELHETKEDKRLKLTPAAEVIVSLIQEEKDKVTDQLRNLPMTIDTTEENVKSVLLAYQLNLRFIDSLQTKITNTMRKA